MINLVHFCGVLLVYYFYSGLGTCTCTCVYVLFLRREKWGKGGKSIFYFLFFILKIPENFLSSWGWSFSIFWLSYVLYIYSFMSTYARQDQLIKPAILFVCVCVNCKIKWKMQKSFVSSRHKCLRFGHHGWFSLLTHFFQRRCILYTLCPRLLFILMQLFSWRNNLNCISSSIISISIRKYH